MQFLLNTSIIIKYIFPIHLSLQVKATQQAFKESQANVQKMTEKNLNLLHHIHKERENAIERLAEFRKLAMANGISLKYFFQIFDFDFRTFYFERR